MALLAIVQLGAARKDLDRARRELGTARTALAARQTDDSRKSLAAADGRLRAAGRESKSLPLPVLRLLPVFGGPVRAAQAAVEAGREAVKAGHVLAAASARFPTNGLTGVDGHDLSVLHAAVSESDAALVTARGYLTNADRKLKGPAGAALPPVSRSARAQRTEVAATLRELDGARRGLALVRDLTAPGVDSRLLLVSQDSMELRPTGGYIGSWGIIHFAHGSVSLDRYASFEDLPPPQPPMQAPPRFAAALDRPWNISGGGWWPDFPTSARNLREMFRRQGGGEVDGVVAITEAVMADIVGALGPISLPGYPQPVTAEGFDKRVLYEVELKRPQDVPRKKFLTELSERVFDELFHLPAEKAPAVAQALGRAGGLGDIQAWFADPARQAYLAGTVWAGALPRTNRDFLMLVDANMTASKANADLTRTVTYRVHRDDHGRLVATVKAVYRNDGDESPVNPYYNGYVRLYVPLGARPTPGQRMLRDEGRAPDGAYRVLSHDLVVYPHSQATVSFSYRLPNVVASGGRYRLVWEQQAGTQRDTLTARIGGRSYSFEPGARRTELTATLRRNRIAEFLRTRWLTRWMVT